MSKQLKLFESRAAYRVEQPKKTMNKEALLKWKARIFNYQQHTLTSQPPEQTSLFDPPKSHCDSNLINPFQLKLHSSTFYRQRQHEEKICIYFIIDNSLPLLLYIGETMQTAKQRWNGVHDCRDYIMNYIELHRKYDLAVKVCSARAGARRQRSCRKLVELRYDTPDNRAARLKLEQKLILRWQSPFNKENWSKYGKPFGKI